MGKALLGPSGAVAFRHVLLRSVIALGGPRKLAFASYNEMKLAGLQRGWRTEKKKTSLH